MVELRVKRIVDDEWSRPRLKNVVTGRMYSDVSCGDERYQTIKYNIAGAWHSVTEDGEPDCPLRSDVNFVLVDGYK